MVSRLGVPSRRGSGRDRRGPDPQQRGDQLIHLGGGEETVYPASFVWSATVTDQGAAVWSPDGRTVIVATTDGLALFSAMGSPVAVFTGCPGTPTAFGWTGSVIAATTDQGRVCAWLAPSP